VVLNFVESGKRYGRGKRKKKIGAETAYHNFTANSLNISTEGLLAESTQYTDINAGDLFNIELDLPPDNITNLIRGKLSAYGKVVRVIESAPRKRQIAFQFCTRPQYDI